VVGGPALGEYLGQQPRCLTDGAAVAVSGEHRQRVDEQQLIGITDSSSKPCGSSVRPRAAGSTTGWTCRRPTRRRRVAAQRGDRRELKSVEAWLVARPMMVALGDAVHAVMVAAFAIPNDDLFQALTGAAPAVMRSIPASV
jgi:hypothetical protein